jgi:putative PIN family toxin of toxin-antitoxin system
MISAVLDTNVVVSGQVRKRGIPAQVSDLALARRFRCFISESLLLEYQTVLLRPRFGFSARDVTELMQTSRRIATVVSPRKRVTVALDPSDNHVLECALEARADYIVTGNLRHFPSQFQDIRVISSRQFMLVFASQL